MGSGNQTTGSDGAPDGGFQRVDPWSELAILVLVLGGIYLLLAAVPVVQLVRSVIRAQAGCGRGFWTTQRAFFVLILLSLLARCAFFVAVPWMEGNFFELDFAAHPAFVILDTIPNILFFTTFTLLVLFWAEIIHHARNQSLTFPQRLRCVFETARAPDVLPGSS
jgi:THH1/TOM1/TOM3 domain